MRHLGILAATVLAFISCHGTMPLGPVAPCAVDFADTTLVVTACFLDENIDSKAIIIIDGRTRAAYDKGHIPGALHVDWAAISLPGNAATFGYLVTPSPQSLAPMLGRLGIAADKHIVIYDAAREGWGEAGRILWVLRMAGFTRSSILDGGYALWTSRGFAVSTEVSAPTSVALHGITYDSSWTISTKDLADSLNEFIIIDSRTSEEYKGAVIYNEVRGGHIPTAVHFDYRKIYNADGTFKNQLALEKLFAPLNIRHNDNIVAYCTAGVRSGMMTIALRMAGYTRARNYDASFYGWARDSALPVE